MVEDGEQPCRYQFQEQASWSAVEPDYGFPSALTIRKGRVNEHTVKNEMLMAKEWMQNAMREKAGGQGNERTRAGRAGLGAGAMWTTDVGTSGGPGVRILKAAYSWT